MYQQMDEILERLTLWVRRQQSSIGAEMAVIGISGGKDSSVTAALAAQALGKDKVFGVMMPRGEQKDLAVAQDLCQTLGIRHAIVPIGDMADAATAAIGARVMPLSRQAEINLPPRLRMTVLYAVAQSINGVVWNTSNLSEDWVGYATIYGDTSGAFSPLATLTTDEVIALGAALGVPERFITIPPADGLTGKTDEEVLGFSYQVLNHYIRTGECADPAIREKIDRLHRQSRFKFQTIPMFQSGFPILADDIAHIYQ